MSLQERHIAKLEEENDVLRARIEELEKLLAPELRIPVEWGLTNREEQCLSAILSREVATKDHIMAAMYGALPDEEPEVKIVDVLVCKIRKKLNSRGITVQTKWGQGWYLDHASREKLLQMVRGAT